MLRGLCNNRHSKRSFNCELCRKLVHKDCTKNHPCVESLEKFLSSIHRARDLLQRFPNSRTHEMKPVLQALSDSSAQFPIWESACQRLIRFLDEGDKTYTDEELATFSSASWQRSLSHLVKNVRQLETFRDESTTTLTLGTLLPVVEETLLRTPAFVPLPKKGSGWHKTMVAFVSRPVVQCNGKGELWLTFACELQYVNARAQDCYSVCHFNKEELCALFECDEEGLSKSHQDLLRAFKPPMSFADAETRLFQEAVTDHANETIPGSKSVCVGRMFSKYVCNLQRGAGGPVSAKNLSSNRKRFRRRRGGTRESFSGSEEDMRAKRVKLEARLEKTLSIRQAQEMHRSGFVLEVFTPTSVMVHSAHQSGNMHCLLHAFHMASRLSVPTVRDMETTIEKYNCHDVKLSRQFGFNMNTLRCTLMKLRRHEQNLAPDFILKRSTKPLRGWSWSRLEDLLKAPGVYLVSCVMNGPSSSTFRHFVVFDSFTAEYGDSIAPCVEKLDLEMARKKAERYEQGSIRAVADVYQLMIQRPIQV